MQAGGVGEAAGGRHPLPGVCISRTIFADRAALVGLVHGVHTLGLRTRGHCTQHLPVGFTAASLTRGHLEHKHIHGQGRTSGHPYHTLKYFLPHAFCEAIQVP